MSHCRITHITDYSYTLPVQLDPHVLRLRPRPGNGIRLLEYDLEVYPAPVQRYAYQDLMGNTVDALYFDGRHTTLRLVSTAVVAPTSYNPYQFVIHPFAASTLPINYEPEIQAMVAPYLIRCSTNVPVTAFASAIAQEVAGDTVEFLSALNQRIFHLCERIIRRDGPPLPPAKTLQRLRGSCRDLAVLFADACRSLGIAARFVSGYLLDKRPDDERELHAWAEVYLPGAGWRGFDPSLGIAVQQEHVAIAAGRVSALAAPVTGAFRGAGAQQQMSSQIIVSGVEVPVLTSC